MFRTFFFVFFFFSSSSGAARLGGGADDEANPPRPRLFFGGPRDDASGSSSAFSVVTAWISAFLRARTPSTPREMSPNEWSSRHASSLARMDSWKRDESWKKELLVGVLGWWRSSPILATLGGERTRSNHSRRAASAILHTVPTTVILALSLSNHPWLEKKGMKARLDVFS